MDSNKSQNRFAVLSGMGGGTPMPAKKKPEPLFGGAYSSNMLGLMRTKMKELYPDHPKSERASREMEGRALKRIGKELGNTSHIDSGRKLQYGHLTPEDLLQKHPSAFLREHNVRANFLQFSASPLVKGGTGGFQEKANQSTAFRLMSHPKESTPFNPFTVESDQIVDSVSGRSHTRKQAFSLIPSKTRPSNDGRKTFNEMTDKDAHVGPEMTAAFLPMVQSKFDALKSKPSRKNVKEFDNGKINSDHLPSAHLVFTTELTGCSIVRQESHLHHIRPESDGAKLHDSFSPSQSYGRRDYPEASSAFVMLRKKPNGAMKLYYQTHHDNAPSVSGSRYLTKS